LEEESLENEFDFLFYLNGLKYLGNIWIIASSLFMILWGLFSPSWWHTGLFALIGMGIFFIGTPLLFIFCELVLLILSIHNHANTIHEDLQEFVNFLISSPRDDFRYLSMIKVNRPSRKKKS